ncbi:MAG: hypothetical protein ACK481_11150 [Candidatus Melainabacteria bacterium]|jgi:hypothetical protein
MKTPSNTKIALLALASIFISNISFLCNAAEEKVIILPEDTEIIASLIKSVSTANAHVGQPIEAEIKKDIVIDERVVIKKGTPVKGTVTHIQKAKRLGQGGSIDIQINSVKSVDNQKVILRSASGKMGKDKVGSTIALSLIVSPLFLLKKGNEAGIRKDTEIKAYVDEDLNVKSAIEPEIEEIISEEKPQTKKK